ncbi:MAG TPA: putative glycolipid-binding domain-containing protein [Actinomycetes bacterium]
MRQRAIAWHKEDPAGAEYAEVTLGAEVLFASGVAIGGEPGAYRLDYSLETGPGFVTTRLQVTARGQGWRRTLDLRRDPAGAWTAATTADGEAPDGLAPPGAASAGGAEPAGPAGLPAPAAGRISWLDGALDCDLGLSPLTNSMPALRHRLLEEDGSADLLMAWVSVPDLGVRASRQRYTALRDRPGGRLIRFESLDSGFTAELAFDADGLVVDYPGIGRQLG